MLMMMIGKHHTSHYLLTTIKIRSHKTPVSREIVGRYERGDAVPSIDIAKRMSDAFEISHAHRSDSLLDVFRLLAYNYLI